MHTGRAGEQNERHVTINHTQSTTKHTTTANKQTTEPTLKNAKASSICWSNIICHTLRSELRLNCCFSFFVRSKYHSVLILYMRPSWNRITKPSIPGVALIACSKADTPLPVVVLLPFPRLLASQHLATGT